MGLAFRGPAVAGALTAAAALAFGVFACGTDDGSSGPRTGATSTTPEPEPLFRALQDDLVATCGGPSASCHVSGTYQRAPTWLGGADPYVTIKKYRGMLPATKEVGDSLLLTQVRHEGPALADAPNDLFRRVSEWLSAEVPGPPLPNTGPFSVQSGFNSVPLDAVASGLTNARLTFLAVDNNGTLKLSSLKLVAPDNASVKIDSPFFVILPRSGKVNADPDSNGFKGELDVAAGQAADFYSGTMILLNWDPTGRLKVAFNKIEPTPGQGTRPGCTALDVFKSSALPAMAMQVTARGDAGVDDTGKSSCLGCHGEVPASGDAPSPAVRAMDLRGANDDPATACAQAKIWINFADKTQSTILLNPLGRANPQHPMDPIDESNPIFTGLKAWVDAEH